MNRIFKYTIPRAGESTIQVPRGFKVLTAQLQHGQIRLWLEVGNNPLISLLIYIFGTGHSIDIPCLTYIATVQDGEFVWHIYHGSPISIGGQDECN